MATVSQSQLALLTLSNQLCAWINGREVRDSGICSLYDNWSRIETAVYTYFIVTILNTSLISVEHMLTINSTFSISLLE